MAKNKKAQILAAVMCATTIVGFSPVITHAAENNIESNNGTSNVTAHDNGYVTVGGTRFEFNSTGGASVIINNSGTLAIKGTGGNAFQADTNGNVTATGYISANRLHTIAAGIGTVDTLTGNRLLSVKDSANTENFFVRTDGLIGSKDSNGNLVFQMKDGAITAQSLKVTNDITLADGTSLQGMANTIKGIDSNGNIPNIAGIRRDDSSFSASGQSSTTIENTLTVDGPSNTVSMKDNSNNQAVFEISKDEGNGQSTKTDVKAGYVGITNKNGDETFAVDSNGAIRAANGAFKVAADGALTTNGITVNNENGFASVIIGNDGSILAGKNGNFQVTSEGVLSVGNNKFTVDQYGGVKANKIISAEMYVGTQTAENKVVTAGQLGTSIDKATEGTIKWDQNDAGEYQEGTLKGIHLNNGNLEAPNIITETFSVVGEDNNTNFQIFNDGSFNAAGEKFTVDANGNVTTQGNVKTDAGADLNAMNDTLTAYKEAGIVAGTNTTDYGIAIGDGSYNTGEYGVVIGKDANNTGFGSMAIGAHASVTGNDSIALGFGSQASEDHVVSVGSYTQQRRIINVADGENDSDAATVGQLKNVQSGVDKTFDEYKEAGIVAGTSTVDNDVVMGDGSYNTGEYGVVIGKDASNTGFGSMAIGAHTMVSGENSIALGFGSQATENNVVSVGGYASGTQRRIINVADGINDSDAATVGQLNKVSQKVEETSGNVAGIDRVENEDGTHTTVINEDTSIKGDLNVDGTLTVGGEQIATGSDVSAVSGKVDKVASDVGDLNNLNSEIKSDNLVSAINAEANLRQGLSNRVDGLEGRVGSLEERMGDVEDRIDKVGAMSAAIANLRTMGYDPEAPTEIAVGVGQYKSETGLALGVFHYPNEDFMLSASISTSGDEVMGGIGATWKIGRKSAQERAIDDEKSHELKAEEKAAEMKEAAQKAKVNAQRERHAQMLAEREAANK